MDIANSLDEILSPIVEFLNHYGIDLYSLLLGITTVTAIALILRSRRKKGAPSELTPATTRSTPRKGVRQVKPGISQAAQSQEQEPAPEPPEPQSSAVQTSQIAAVESDPSGLQLRELRIQIALGLPEGLDNKPRKKPSKEDQWEQPKR